MRHFLGEISDLPVQERFFDLENIRRQLKQSSDKKEFKLQIKAYQELGDYYLQVKKNPLNAIALYNFALGVVNDDQKNQSYKEDVKNYQEDIVKQIKAAEKLFLLSIMGKDIVPSDYAWDQAHQEYLKAIRDEARAQLGRHQSLTETITLQLDTTLSRLERILLLEERLEQEQLSIRQIYRDISEQLRIFVRLMIEECQKILENSNWEIQKPSQADYAIICFGSLARDEATPYSDLEFGVLLSDKANTEETKIYFRVLTKLLNIKVLNLGETSPRFHEIKELKAIGLCGRYSESPNKPGWSFDGNNAGGRKTPLGNWPYDDVPEGHRYELIGTPESMAELHNEDWYQKDKHLSTVLMTARILVGNEALLERYKQAKQLILGESIDELVKEFEELLEVVSVSSKSRIQRRSLEWLQESVEEYQFRGGRFDKEGHFFDAKYHLYRLPNMLIDHLASYFNVSGYSLWERIENLFGDKGRLPNATGQLNLHQVISKVLHIRLQAYLNKDCRDNHVVMLDPENPSKNERMLRECFSLNQADLFRIYTVFVLLQYTVQEFVAKKASESVFLKSSYYDPSPIFKGYIYSLLLDYVNAVQSYEEAKKNLEKEETVENIFVAFTLSSLGEIYRIQSRYSEAIDAYKKARQIFSNFYSPNHIYFAFLKNDLGNVYCLQAQYPGAIKMYKFSESIAKSIESSKDLLVANILCNIGTVYQAQAKYSKAVLKYEKAEKILSGMYGSEHISVATVMNNLGATYIAQEKYLEAEITFNKIKKFRKTTYGPRHISLAEIFNNFGTIYHLQGKYLKAISSYEKAKKIFINIYGYEHVSVATTLGNLGDIYRKQGRYVEAIKVHREAEQILTVVHHNKQHISFVTTLQSLGAIYRSQLRYSEACKLYEEALFIQRSFLGDDHPSVAETFNNLGVVYEKQSNYSEAIVEYKKAKHIFEKSYGYIHVTVATALDNLGNVYQAQGEYEKAILSYGKAKKIYISVFDESHIFVADVLNNLGLVYEEIGKHQEAIDAYEESIRIKTNVFDSEHISVADTLNNLGLVYGAQGKYAEAIVVYEKANRIQIAFHHAQHVSVAETLNNLGQIYAAQKRYADAISAYKTAKKIKISTYGPQHIAVASTLNNLGDIYVTQGRYAKAIAACEKAKRIRIDTHGRRHISVARVLNTLGNAYFGQRKYKEAIIALEEAKEIKLRTYGRQHISVAKTLINLSNVLVEQRAFEKARQLLGEAIEIFSQLDHSYEGTSLVNVFHSYLQEGNTYLLQEKMDIEKATIYYQDADVPLDPANPETHRVLAKQFFKKNCLLMAIDHCQILLKLRPDDSFAHYSLARLIHVLAQIEKDQKEYTSYRSYLKKSESHFSQAIFSKPNIRGYTVYAQFLLKNQEEYTIELIVSTLRAAVDLKKDDKELSYTIMERPTIDENLQRLLDEEGEIFFKARFVAYYLLVKVYCLSFQLRKAKELFLDFRVEANQFISFLKIEQNSLSFCVSISVKSHPRYTRTFLALKEKFKKESSLLISLLALSESMLESVQRKFFEKKSQFFNLIQDYFDFFQIKCSSFFGAFISDINENIIGKIFWLLSLTDFLRARLVNKNWSNLCSRLLIWHRSDPDLSLLADEDKDEIYTNKSFSI